MSSMQGAVKLVFYTAGGIIVVAVVVSIAGNIARRMSTEEEQQPTAEQRRNDVAAAEADAFTSGDFGAEGPLDAVAHLAGTFAVGNIGGGLAMASQALERLKNDTAIGGTAKLLSEAGEDKAKDLRAFEKRQKDYAAVTNDMDSAIDKAFEVALPADAPSFMKSGLSGAAESVKAVASLPVELAALSDAGVLAIHSQVPKPKTPQQINAEIEAAFKLPPPLPMLPPPKPLPPIPPPKPLPPIRIPTLPPPRKPSPKKPRGRSPPKPPKKPSAKPQTRKRGGR